MATEPSWAGFRRMDGVQPMPEAVATSGRRWSPWRPWLRDADLNGRQWRFRRATNRMSLWIFVVPTIVLKSLHWSKWTIAAVLAATVAAFVAAQRCELHRLRDR